MESRQGPAGAMDVSKARTVFMGTPAFASIILGGILDQGWNVVALVCQPDRPKGRGRRVQPPPAKLEAQAHSIPVLQPERMGDPFFLERLREFNPDWILVAAFGRILPSEVLRLPPLGCYNVHASLLPAYRGAAPISWAILNGEKLTGITLFRMDEGLDTGDILAAAPLAIDPDETAGELGARLARLAVDILPSSMEQVLKGTARFVPQDHSRATWAPPLTKKDGEILWTLSAEEIRNRVRGLDPWPGAYTFWRGIRLRLWKAAADPEAESGREPGEVVGASAEGLRVATGQGILVVRSLQLEGGRRMTVEEFLRGHRIRPGERFGVAAEA
jgi:methionyl-tRNA formyltransferase